MVSKVIVWILCIIALLAGVVVAYVEFTVGAMDPRGGSGGIITSGVIVAVVLVLLGATGIYTQLF